MFWTLSNTLCKPLSQKTEEIPSIALARIYLHKLTTNDILLNNYLQATYHKTLKSLCYSLIKNKLKINIDNMTQSIIVSFKDPQSDKLANLIKYGNERVPGSHILDEALDQKY